MIPPRRVCHAWDLSPGEVLPVSLGPDERGRPREALVLYDHEGELRAYVNRCAHLPIPLDAGSREFLNREGTALMCSTHGALYRLEDGFCTEGPCAGESLLALPVRVDDDGYVELTLEG